MKLNAIQIREACNGQFLVEPSDTATFAVEAVVDSRKVKCGSMFVAMPGTKVDGFKFIEDSLNKQASVILCEKEVDKRVKVIAENAKSSIILVDNCEKALQDVARYWRDSLSSKVIAVTGSTGKTTTRNLIADVLQYKFSCCVATENHNNELGLPITVCSCETNNQVLITEMGMYARGEIELLCNIAKPEWGIITNIGECHIERLGSKDNIAKAKSELAAAVPNNIGKMFLPADDNYLDFIIEYAQLKKRNVDTILFGSKSYKEEYDCPQLWYEDVFLDDNACASFIVCYKESQDAKIQKSKCQLAVQGMHNVLNACAACAVGVMAGISLDDCTKTLKESKAQQGRQNTFLSRYGFSVINDAYNANPQSMRASLHMFDALNTNLSKIAVLSDMAELGDYAEVEHKKIGEYIAKLNLDKVYCTGELSKQILFGAENGGMKKDKLRYFKNNDELYNYLVKNLSNDTIILVKASNCMGFQTLVNKLV